MTEAHGSFVPRQIVSISICAAAAGLLAAAALAYYYRQRRQRREQRKADDGETVAPLIAGSAVGDADATDAREGGCAGAERGDETAIVAASVGAASPAKSGGGEGERGVLVVYCSQTGTARRLAGALVDELSRDGVPCQLQDPVLYEPEDLPKERVLLLVASTWQHGSPPDHAAFFLRWLHESASDFRVGAALLAPLRFAVFGLGSSAYDEAEEAGEAGRGEAGEGQGGKGERAGCCASSADAGGAGDGGSGSGRCGEGGAVCCKEEGSAGDDFKGSAGGAGTGEVCKCSAGGGSSGGRYYNAVARAADADLAALGARRLARMGEYDEAEGDDVDSAFRDWVRAVKSALAAAKGGSGNGATLKASGGQEEVEEEEEEEEEYEEYEGESEEEEGEGGAEGLVDLEDVAGSHAPARAHADALDAWDFVGEGAGGNGAGGAAGEGEGSGAGGGEPGEQGGRGGRGDGVVRQGGVYTGPAGVKKKWFVRSGKKGKAGGKGETGGKGARGNSGGTGAIGVGNGAVAAAEGPREMVTPVLRANLEKQGYRVLGSHSGVKVCRWTKAQLRGRGGCYKHSFYGIQSHLCMEATPSLACANKCVFCWRHHTNPVGKSWRWQVDEPEDIVEGALAGHVQMIKQMKGVPGVKPERLAEAMTPRHCALSLVGEPIMYPHINRLLALLHGRRISSFLVTNAQFPDKITNLHPVTQLYVSVDAGTKESLKAIDRPLFGDFWERFTASLTALRSKQQRTVYRLTLVTGWNTDELKAYADLLKLGQPDFIEIKGVTYCGSTGASSLTMQNVPYHEDVRRFAAELGAAAGEAGAGEYELACEHEHSCCVLLALSAKFKAPDGTWHTWIDYDKFHQLVASGQPFSSTDYMAPTPPWAVFGAKEAGFDPQETRVRREKKAGAV
ncbi:unnamed protein product [Closterium sp. Naga37s-1]|nr:unnamed protein product [Closterium sp. Naga37s-1]